MEAQVRGLAETHSSGFGILSAMRPAPLLVIAFVAVPLAEIALFLAVGRRIGVLPTLVIVLATAVIGASLVSRQGRGELARARTTLMAGAFPSAELAHGAMILLAGALLLTPGFITDTAGFLLLVPPVRERVRAWLARRYGRGVVDLG
jgi:UPF0716 protein FxsA